MRLFWVNKEGGTLAGKLHDGLSLSFRKMSNMDGEIEDKRSIITLYNVTGKYFVQDVKVDFYFLLFTQLVLDKVAISVQL